MPFYLCRYVTTGNFFGSFFPLPLDSCIYIIKFTIMKPEEYKETMKTLAQDENLLPGIYNFCDQWCIKCSWTDRCFTHRMSILDDGQMEDKCIDDPEFLEGISTCFQAAGLMLREQAEELGIDLDNLEDDELEKDQDAPYSTCNWPDYVKMSEDYGFAVLEWMQKNNLDISESLKTQLNISEENAGVAFEAFETIQKYCLFIGSKMRVAISIFHDEPDIMADEANGMMKIAIETTERSIKAYQKLWEIMQEQEESILNFLTTLEKIRKKANDHFPNAAKFDYFKCFATMQ